MAKSADPATLQAIMNEINKSQGAGAVILGSELNYEQLPRISSGSLSLDVSLGGGWPVNQWHEIYGEFSSGKTALVLHTIAENQAEDPEWRVWWLAAEHFDPGFAKLCGVDVNRVFVHDTNVMEVGYQRILEVAETREVDCIVIDSYPALVVSAEAENDVGNSLPGLGARTNNQFWRKQRPVMSRSLVSEDRPVTGFVINQPREKIGVMFGPNETTPGGRGKNFAYFTRVETRRAGWIKEDDETVGITIKATVVKNKSARPNRTATWDFYFSTVGDREAGSYDTIKEIVDVSVAYEVIDPKPGGMYYYAEELVARGRQAVYDKLRSDPEMRAAIRHDVLQVVRGMPVDEGPADVEPEPPKKAVAVKKLAPRKAKT